MNIPCHHGFCNNYFYPDERKDKKRKENRLDNPHDKPETWFPKESLETFKSIQWEVNYPFGIGRIVTVVFGG